MFNSRLKIFILLVVMLMTVLLVRLVQLQVYGYDQHIAETEKLLKRSPRWLETARGSILDRNGEVLASDVPRWRIRVHYKLARLFDRRFYRYFACSYRNREGKANASDAEILEYFSERFGFERFRAGEMVQELASLANVTPDEILAEIDRVNDEIFATRLWLARRKYYSRNNLERPVVHSKQEYFDDYERIMPDEFIRLRSIYRDTEIMEMNEPQPILEPVDRQLAMEIENHFNGEFLANTDSNRLISIGADKERIYPHGAAAPQIIGQIAPTQQQYNRITISGVPLPNELAGYQVGDRKGLWGIEYMFEDYLHGSRGWQQRNIDGELIENIEQAVGADITLTLDINLQADIQSLLAGHSSLGMKLTGGAVVLDVKTGEILAMASMPGFDLNRFYEPEVYSTIWPETTPAPLRTPLTNLALSWNYQAGSTLKPTNLLGGLEHGVIDVHTTYYVDSSSRDWKIGPSDIHVFGNIDPFTALKRSCNYYPVRVAELLGPEMFVDWLKASGFGRRILAWPDEYSRNRSWFAFRETAGFVSTIGREYPAVGDMRYAAIGRGPISCSVLQIANSMATISRNGQYLAPTLIKDPPVVRSAQALASEDNTRIIRKGMFAVVNEPGGTAWENFRPLPWQQDIVRVYGKTGSTDYSVFGCFAESFDGRKVALAVLAEIEENGGNVAGPLARDILLLCAEHGYLPNPN
ncbi:MAG: hypothetical protein JXM68_01675 [Sedimentisphaerales bacterium]|nr:hypothetical protein [Sedimentisphaerales bacterium]